MSQTDKRRILVVDDEQRVRQAVQRVLSESGYEVFLAEDGREGLKLVAQHTPDLVLVDLMMPVMDGMEFLDQARRRYPGLISVVISGFATLDKAVEAMKHGADDFLAKPFKPSELKLVVGRALKQAAALQNLSTEKSRNRALVNAMSNGVLVVNPQGGVVTANRALLGLLNSGLDQMEGKPSRTVLPWPEVSETLVAVMADDDLEPVQTRCQCSLGEDDDALHFQVSCAPFYDARNAVTGAVAVFDDVTAWHRLDQVKSEFVTTVAHDIVSPLGAVQAQLYNLAQGLLGPLEEQQLSLVGRARERLQGIADFSKDLLELAKIEAGAMGQPSRLDLEPVLRQAMDMLQGPGEAKQQNLQIEITGDLPAVMGVEGELREVVLNLVSNAVKYTQEGGEVLVRAFGDGAKFVLEVRDNGPGIPEEEREAIFSRFYRVRNADNRHIIGTGLGLAIVKRVVENHGGRLELDSAPGRGSCFRVLLPAV